MSPITEINNKFEKLLQQLPADWKELAREKRAWTRRRKIKSEEELLRAVFSYAVADYSLREVAGLLTRERQTISDEAVRARLNQCVEWLESLLSETVFESAKQFSISGRRLKLVDGTVLCCPAAKGTDYRVPLCFDAIEQRGCGVKLTDDKGAESLTHFQFESGDVVFGDRLYGQAKQLIAVKKQAAEVVVRLSLQQLRLYDEQGALREWKAALIKAQDAGRFTWEAFDKGDKGELEKVYVHGYRLSERECEKARRRIKKNASKKGYQTRAETLLLCEWIIVLTTLAPEELRAETILQLYRIRWQIELYIKRLKSILQLGEIRAGRDSALAKVHILAKMLYAVLLEKLAVQRVGIRWTVMSSERRGTWFRIWKLMKDEFIEAIICTVHWKDWDWRFMLKVLSERKRKRKLQQLPKEVIRWLHQRTNSKGFVASKHLSEVQLAA